jgi:hypothetical protein
MNSRKQWFIDRIGKRVFRNDTQCCEHCDKVYKEGLVISDESHAYHLYDCECEMDVKYFDTKDEVTEFEKTLK